MHAISQILRGAAILSALAFTALPLASAAEKKTEAKPADLQVTVQVPPSWRPFLDDDIAENFAYRLSTAFKRQGYKGHIVYVDRADPPAADVPVIAISLVEWRIGRNGNAQCTFTATFTSAKGAHDLGVTTNSAIFWPQSSGRWNIRRAFEQADALEDAAEGALRDFYKRLVKDNLLPAPAAK
jgi:hypothetical protein